DDATTEGPSSPHNSDDDPYQDMPDSPGPVDYLSHVNPIFPGQAQESMISKSPVPRASAPRRRPLAGERLASPISIQRQNKEDNLEPVPAFTPPSPHMAEEPSQLMRLLLQQRLPEHTFSHPRMSPQRQAPANSQFVVSAADQAEAGGSQL